jgi:hypothetical protein
MSSAFAVGKRREIDSPSVTNFAAAFAHENRKNSQKSGFRGRFYLTTRAALLINLSACDAALHGSAMRASSQGPGD